MADLFLMGRLIFGGFFLYSGVHHFLDTATLAQYAGAKGVPMPEAAVLLTGALLIVGALSILLGILPRPGLACIILFLVGVTPIMHAFWSVPDPQIRQMDMGNFMKNLALLGGALMMLMIPTPWAYSVEARRRIAV
jgi:putative oxidoreductase